MGLGSVHDRPALRPVGYQTQVAHERFETAAKTGAGDHRIGLDAVAIGQQHVGAVEALDRGDYLDLALLQLLDQADVQDRGDVFLEEACVGVRRGFGPAVLRQVADDRFLQNGPELVHQAFGHRAQRYAEHLPRHAVRLTKQHGRRAAHRHHHVLRAALDQVDDDLGARVAGAYHEHGLADVGVRVAVVARVDELAAEAVHAWPVGELLMLVVTGRDDHTRGEELVAVLGRDAPLVTVACELLDFGARTHVEVLDPHVVLEVLDDVVARHPFAVARGHLVAGQVREPADRVQVEAVVVLAPRGPDRLALEHDRAHAVMLESSRGRKTCGAAADYHYLVSRHAPRIW